MKKTLSRHAGGWLVALLGMLGFATGCSGATEYGTPNADYQVQGSVRLAGENRPLVGVQVRALVKDPDGMYHSTSYLPSTTTDANGQFQIQCNSVSLYGSVFPLEFSREGVVKTDTVDVSFENIQPSGGKKWYAGTAVRTVEFTLDAAEAPAPAASADLCEPE